MLQGERPVVTLVGPSRSQVWRAGLPYHVIGLFGLLFIVVDPQNYPGMLWFVLAMFLLGTGRSFAWLLGVGAYSVVDTGTKLGLARRGTVVNAIPWTEIRKVEWGGGSRFPSVDDPVLFPLFEIDPVDANGDYVMQPILVLGRRARENAANAVAESCRRHGLPCEISGPDKGISVMLLGRLWRRSRRRD